MKKMKFLTSVACATLLFVSCSNDDAIPEPVNEEEIITTLTVTLTPNFGGTPITLQTRDLDGDGPNPPEMTVSDKLAVGVTYNGTIVLLNETVNPPEDITEEVKEEDLEHQFFYTIGSSLDAVTAYVDFDSQGNPLGTQFTLTAGTASTGSLTFTLRHEPTKPNTSLSDAGGETDFASTFNITIE